MNIQDAIDVIESVSGFTDESTPVGEAWAEVLSFIHRPTIQPVPVPDNTREAVYAAVSEALGSAYDCLRVWEAWGCGTMGPDDFYLVAKDDDRVAEIADAAIEAIRSTNLCYSGVA